MYAVSDAYKKHTDNAEAITGLEKSLFQTVRNIPLKIRTS